MLLNAYLCDMFFMTDFVNIENYVKYKTLYSIGLKLKKAPINIFKWFYGNSMKTSQKHIGVVFDRKLNFNKYFTNLFHKTSKKIKYLH